jgi:hypothetical protein
VIVICVSSKILALSDFFLIPSSFVPHSYANSVLQALYFCYPFRDLVIQSIDISVPPLPAAYPDRHHLRCQPPTANPILLRRKSERGTTALDIPCPTPQPSSSPQRPQPSSPLSTPSTRSFPGKQLTRARLHHVPSLTSFAMGMSTSVVSCTKTRTSFSAVFCKGGVGGTLGTEQPRRSARQPQLVLP